MAQAVLTIPYTNGDDNQIWLKGTGTAGQVWNFTVSGLPTGATIVSVKLTFTSGNTYNAPGRTEIFWGTSEIADNRLWYVSNSSGGGESRTVDLSSHVTDNGTYSLYFRKVANSAGTQSNVYFSGVTVTVTYEKPAGTIKHAESGQLVTYRLYHAENGSLVPYDICHAENGQLVKY